MIGNAFPLAMSLNFRALAAEFLGTFLLALVVRLSLTVSTPLATPILAGLTLGFLVYAVGGISGAHVNPAVTVALASVRNIRLHDAVAYVVAQCLGALLALVVAQSMTRVDPSLIVTNVPLIWMCEAIGAFVLVLGVASVVHGKTPHDASGLTIGSALLLGITVASTGSNGVLNPAVALGIGSVSLAYLLAPIIGGVIAVWVYRGMLKG